ncbi:hypothetical protein SAY87_001375 [Trapa incisa]|uniref:NAC domain-containing protein n=1 Tax=Trapa incisa TaxID=236973 RepID=A0AAN7GKD1_9MYRT|nr:hypothetical protein SAY87_001375 [Trapa incisa]
MEEVMSMSEGDPEIIHLPPGFRFHPTDEEIITHYLAEKAMNNSFTAAAIGEVDLNKCEPWDLHKRAKMGEKEWYFFSQKDRKYPTGLRTNRATESGYWKATGKDKEVYRGKNCLIGMKKTLVFYLGRAPKGQKTNWVMHEYRLEGKFSYPNLPKDEWVVCRMYHKTIGKKKPMGPAIPGSGSLPPLVESVSASAGPSSSFGDGVGDEFNASFFPFWNGLPGMSSSHLHHHPYRTLNPNWDYSVLDDEVSVVQGSAINPTYLNRSVIGGHLQETPHIADVSPHITSSSSTLKQEVGNQIEGCPFVGTSDSSDIFGFSWDD